MNRKKGQIGLFGMVIIGIAILAVMYLVQSNWVQKGFKIRAEARIFVEVNDESTKIVSLLKSKTSDLSCMEALARELESLPAGATEGDIAGLADKLNVAIILYDEDGKVKKRYGKREAAEGDTIRVKIPLPGGRSSMIGIVSDVEIPDYGKFSGGGGGGFGGGGAGGG